MPTRRAVLLLIGIGVLAAVTTSTLDDHTGGVSADNFDCRNITGTPTASATPSPTPPWIPYFAIDICNDTASAASDLHLVLRHHAVNLGPGAYPLGCPYPGYAYSGGDLPEYTVVDINYGTPCVDPGESVYIFLHTDCTTPEPGCEPPVVACYYWTLDGLPIPSVSPAINPFRCENPQPVPTPDPITPTPPDGRTNTPTPTPYRTPTITPNPVTITYIMNDTSSSALGLILSSHGTVGYFVSMNPLGCTDFPNIFWEGDILDPLTSNGASPALIPASPLASPSTRVKAANPRRFTATSGCSQRRPQCAKPGRQRRPRRQLRRRRTSPRLRRQRRP